MKRSTVMAIVLVCALGAPDAFGQNYVWWEAEGLSPGAQVLNDGPGQTLQLYCEQADQPTTIFRWHVTMRINNIEPLFGWSCDLATHDSTVSIAAFDYLERYYNDDGQFLGYLPFNGVFPQISLGTGVNLLEDQGAASLTSAPLALESGDADGWNVIEFELVKSFGAPVGQPSRVFGRSGAFGYGPEFGNFFNAIVGANPETAIAQPLTEYALPVITIAGPGTGNGGDSGSVPSPWFVPPPPPPPPPPPEPDPPVDPVTPPDSVDPPEDTDPPMTPNDPPDTTPPPEPPNTQPPVTPTPPPPVPPSSPAAPDNNPNTDQGATGQPNASAQPPPIPPADLRNAVSGVNIYTPTVLPEIDQTSNGALTGPLATPFGACGAMGVVSFAGFAFLALGPWARRKRRRR